MQKQTPDIHKIDLKYFNKTHKHCQKIIINDVLAKTNAKNSGNTPSYVNNS